MSDEPVNNNTGLQLSDNAQLSLSLNNMDRLAVVILAAGLGIVWGAIAEADETTFLENAHELSVETDAWLNTDIALKVAEANKMNIVASMVYYFASVERLKQMQESLPPDAPSTQIRLQGREQINTANLLLAFSFWLIADGFTKIAQGAEMAEQETPVP